MTLDADSTWRLRLRHALRCATGGAVIAAIGLTTPATTGCTPSVIFFISAIAGTPENHQGFQLRSASLTFVGAILGLLFYLIIALIATSSPIPTFFAAIPPILFLSFLRVQKSLLPLPPVANVYLGFLLISRFGDPRSTLPRTLAAFLAEAAIGFTIAILVNLPFPDRAADNGRHIIALQLRTLGTLISSIATKTFSRPNFPTTARSPLPNPANDSQHYLSLFLDDTHPNHVDDRVLLPEDYLLLTGNFPRHRLIRRPELEAREQMIRDAEASLAYMHDLRPFGRARVSDYAVLARACQLFEASDYEPRILPESASRWRNVAAWKDVVVRVRALVNKVAALESVACIRAGGESRFSDEDMLAFFGDAYLPLWVAHFASCSAACAKMSKVMCAATCKDMFHLPDINGVAGEGDVGKDVLHWAIDPRKWHARRAHMYFGFLVRYRLGLRQFCRQKCRDQGPWRRRDNLQSSSWQLSRAVARPSTQKVSQKLVGMKHSVSVMDMRALSRQMSRPEEDRDGSLDAPMYSVAVPMSERQALSYFCITSQALAEEVGHIQQAMTELAASSDARGLLAPLYFLVTGFSALWNGSKVVFKRKFSTWEVRFAVTHATLLSSILALALFLPLRERFEASELAWTYTSAALAAQLSAEPTLFIGTIRVFATIMGALFAFGFNSILNVVGRETSKIQYIIIPYIFIVTVTCLMFVPPSFRYASFLLVVTNAVMIFCPRSSAECTQVLEQQSSDCFPDWQYAVSRSINVSLGVVFAVFFHLMLWPRFANKVALQNLANAFINASRLFRKLHRIYFAYGTKRNEYDSPKSILSPSNMQSSLFDEDIYSSGPMIEEIQEHVGEPLADTMLIVNSEADVWRRGPFRLYPLIPHLLSDFVALNVSLGEMAAVLGRRPIFSPGYGRSVFEHYILPMMHMYETIQISLHNLVGVTDRAVGDKHTESLRENVGDLRQAIMHLARTRGQLRKDAEKRALEFKKFSAMALSHRRPGQYSSAAISVDDVFAQFFVDDIEGELPQRRKISRHTRSRSADDISLDGGSGKLCVDDVVLYDAFTLITDACLSAFVRIAVTVLSETESQLKDVDKKRE